MIRSARDQWLPFASQCNKARQAPAAAPVTLGTVIDAIVGGTGRFWKSLEDISGRIRTLGSAPSGPDELPIMEVLHERRVTGIGHTQPGVIARPVIDERNILEEFVHLNN
ncbi:hypothetical protein J6590_017537 [Homalodisca vitripennis]|nr:hypothetical protein J6590_017537 [Homalodisca vitripennis]